MNDQQPLLLLARSKRSRSTNDAQAGSQKTILVESCLRILYKWTFSACWFDHSPISTWLHIASGYPYKAQSSFKLNVSLLESEDCRNVIAWVWSLVPTPVWEISWISWWEAAILRTAKFLQGWGRIVARLEKGTESQVHNCLQVAQQSLKVDHVNELC